MIFKNVNGQSYGMFPTTLSNPNDPASTLVTTRQISGNKIVFLSGSVLTKVDALAATKTSILALPNVLGMTPVFDLTYTYDLSTKKRIIRKSIVDALEFSYTAAGTIGYAAIFLNDPDTGKDCIIFTDSIGTWGQNQMPIIIDNKIGVVGTKNIFKNISIELTDKSSLAI